MCVAVRSASCAKKDRNNANSMKKYIIKIKMYLRIYVNRVYSAISLSALKRGSFVGRDSHVFILIILPERRFSRISFSYVLHCILLANIFRPENGVLIPRREAV